ncbi:MAG: ATP-binding protein [Porticoccaceae bacterium]
MDLIDLLKRPEGTTLEFKRDLSSPEGVLRAIVAFANTAGGVLLLGVADATHNVRGVAKPLAMEERRWSVQVMVQQRLLVERLPYPAYTRRARVVRDMRKSSAF